MSELYDDPRLLERLRAGDRLAQELVWRAERKRLEGLAASVLRGAAADVEELVADLFCDFFARYVHELRTSQAIPAYLRVMAVRRARRRRERLARQVEVEPETLTAAAVDPLHALHDEALRRRLEGCLEQLTLRARRILRLHFGHDQSYAVISDGLGVTRQAVGKTVGKSLGALRRCLEQGGLALADGDAADEGAATEESPP